MHTVTVKARHQHADELVASMYAIYKLLMCRIYSKLGNWSIEEAKHRY